MIAEIAGGKRRLRGLRAPEPGDMLGGDREKRGSDLTDLRKDGGSGHSLSKAKSSWVGKAMIDLACEKGKGIMHTKIRIIIASIREGTTSVRREKGTREGVLGKVLISRDADLSRSPPDSTGVGLTVRIIRGAKYPGDGREDGRGTLLEPEMTTKA